MLSTSRRNFMRTASAGLLALGMTNPVFAQNTRKNVLFIAVDDLRPQLACYGQTQIHSPHIDQLAGEGILFENSFCNVPVCGASRASLLSGARPMRNRFVNFDTWKRDDLPDCDSLPMHFKKNGYVTLSNGKIYHHKPDDLGAWSEEPWRPEGEWGGRGYLLPEHYEMTKANPRGLGPAWECADVQDNQYADGKIAEKGIADLQRLAKKELPFFLALGFLKPHLPFNAPKKYWDLYPHEEIDLADNPFQPKDAPDSSIHNWGELRQYEGIPKEGPLSDEQARWMVHGYYACVSYTDAQIGKVLAELDRLGLKENTVVILWGDHGWNLGEHGLWCKHCNYKTSLRTPMIVSAPGFQGGLRTSRLTEYVDIYPSLCELCGLNAPDHLDGKSFVPLMKNPAQPWKDAVYSRFIHGDTMTTERYAYTEYHNAKGESMGRMLYDHQADPHENMNISELPENQELIKELSARLWKGNVPKNRFEPKPKANPAKKE